MTRELRAWAVAPKPIAVAWSPLASEVGLLEEIRDALLRIEGRL